jgi:LPS export ABC transporter protein LptC
MKRTIGRRWAPTLILAAAAVGCGEEATTATAAPELLEMGADVVQTGMVTLITREGVREGEIFADTAYLYQDSSVAILTNPVLTLYTETGALRARVESEWGKLYENTQEMVARGNVVLTIQEGNKEVETAELHYDPNGDRIWSDSLTVLREEGVVSTGLGFESDLEFRNTRVGPGSIRRTGSGGGIRF